MSYIDKRNKVRDKILAHDNFIFSDEEEYLMTDDEELLRLYIDTLIEYPELLDQFKEEKDFIFNLDDETLSRVSLPLILKYCEICLNDDYADKDECLELADYLDESIREEYIKKVKEMPINLKDSITLSISTIEELLNDKNYDYLARNSYKINFEFMSEDLLMRFLDEFPFDRYGLPSSIEEDVVNWQNKENKDIIFTKLCEKVTSDTKLSMPILFNLLGENINSDVVVSVITNRILNGDIDTEWLRNAPVGVEHLISNYYQYLDDEQKKAVRQKFIDSGNIDFIFLLNDSEETNFTYDEFNKIIDALNSGKKIYLFTTSFENLMRNPFFKDAVIKSGSIDVLLNCNNLDNDDINKIINEIKREGSNYNLKVGKNATSDLLFSNPELFETLLTHGLFSKIKFYILDSDEIKNIIVEYVVGGGDLSKTKIDFYSVFEKDYDAIEKFITSGHIDVVLNYPLSIGIEEDWCQKNLKMLMLLLKN